MNASNMFGANEIAAFGSKPTAFEVFDYRYTPAFVGGFTPYAITVGGSGLPAGTFLAASSGSHEFSTPFTTTGLVGGDPVPEPSQIAFLLGGAALLGLMQWRKQRQQA